MTLKEAKALRAAMLEAAPSLSDQTASTAPMMFDSLKQNSELVKAGTRINWNGVVKRAAVDLWDTAESAPDVAVSLWEDLNYKNGIRIIPDVITAGLAFAKGESGYWNDVLHVSLIDNNVWTPDTYPTGWEVAEE